MKQRAIFGYSILTGGIILAALLLGACENPSAPDTIYSPVTCTPASGSSTADTTPLLDWEDVPGATAYHLQINTNDTFTDPMVEEFSALTSSQHQITTLLADNTTYCWRVDSLGT